MRIIKWFFILIGIIILGLFLRGLYLNNLGNVVKNLKLTDEPKQLAFKVNYGGFIPLGKATIVNQGREKFKNRDVYHLHADASPTWLVDVFAEIKAEADSFVDKEKLHTLKFSHKLNVSGELKEDKLITYDQKIQVMEIADERRKILPNTQDPLSAIFYLMNINLKNVQEIDLNLNTNQKNYQLLATKKKEISIKKNNKKHNISLIEGKISRRDGSFRHSSDFSVWVLDSHFNIPVLVKVFTNIGPITVKLSEIR